MARRDRSDGLLVTTRANALGVGVRARARRRRRDQRALGMAYLADLSTVVSDRIGERRGLSGSAF